MREKINEQLKQLLYGKGSIVQFIKGTRQEWAVGLA